jgi:hypothetical protein
MMICRRGNSKENSPWARRGSLLAEVAMSGAMLMIAMALTVKVLGWVGVERKVWDRRQWAAQEAANLMEEITSRPFGDVTTESAKKLALSPEARRLLPEAELKIEVGENDRAGGAGSKRIALQLRWHNRSGEWDAPVRLVSWIYRGGPGR